MRALRLALAVALCLAPHPGNALTGAGRLIVLASSGSQYASPPQTSILTSGTTYATPKDAYGRSPLWLDVELIGPGGPGAGGGTSPGNGAASTGATSFGSVTAGVGAAASGVNGGAAGTCTGADYSKPTQKGGPGANGFTFAAGGYGGGWNGTLQGGGAVAPPANSGLGGAGGGSGSAASPGGGGGQGADCVIRIANPAASYSIQIGPASTGGLAGANGSAGAPGAAGGIIVTANFQ